MKLHYDTYYDKVLGAWLGKCAGGILGAPVEGVKAFNNIKLSKKLFEVNYPNDDLDLQILWLDLVKKKGPSVRESDFGRYWLDHVGFPWNEYGIATRNLNLGIYPPDSGYHNNYYYGESMGCPIRSELWGLLNPGDPKKAAFYAGIDASLDHFGFSVDAEKFLSACMSLAFFETSISSIFKSALAFIDDEGVMSQLVKNIIKWHKNSGFKTARGKIKSFYGDADFTSAPMNVAFSLLVLLERGENFDCVIDALNMGHDSDCIAATSAALVGAILGYANIPEGWKSLVGNELLVSKEIMGINAPATITELAVQTCKTGITFIKASQKINLIGHLPEEYKVVQKDYHISTSSASDELIINYENLTNRPQHVELLLKSKTMKFDVIRFNIKADAKKNVQVISKVAPIKNTNQPAAFSIEIFINSKKAGVKKRGFANYGSWLLVGPFIDDDEELLDKLHPQFPEHGLSSLPSVQYMNHDKVNLDKSFLSMSQLEKIMDSKNWDPFPFSVLRIFPKDFRIELNKYYYGRGERTIYLVSRVVLETEKKLWIVVGSSAPFELSFNKKKVYKENETKRSWLGNAVVLQQFKKGTNTIILKLNLITDENLLEIGFREFSGKHPHQEQWSLLTPAI